MALYETKPRHRICWIGLLVATTLSLPFPAFAQMVALQMPLQTSSDRFFESNSIGWGFERGNFRFQWPGGNAVPPFGGFDPNSAANLGIGFRGPGGGRFSANLTMAQGSNRTNSVTTPFLVVPNGGFGAVSDSSFRPFVTGFVPVVNDGFVVQTVSPLQERIARLANEPPSLRPEPSKTNEPGRREPAPTIERPSSAERGDVGIREIRRVQAIEDAHAASELRELLEKARQAEKSGKLAVARNYFRMAWRRTSGDQRDAIEQELRTLSSRSTQMSE